MARSSVDKSDRPLSGRSRVRVPPGQLNDAHAVDRLSRFDTGSCNALQFCVTGRNVPVIHLEDEVAGSSPVAGLAAGVAQLAERVNPVRITRLSPA